MQHIFANWKMYLDFDESVSLAQGLAKENFDTNKVNLAVFPSSLALKQVMTEFAGSSFAVGPQNISWTPKGAYTGAVSALMYKDIGCRYALVGHSERRYIFGESNDDVRKKLEACLDADLIPVLCIGETEQDKKDGKTQYRLKKQLMKALEGLDLGGKELIVAYEPVWAIGTGNPCNPVDADDIQGWLKQELKQYTEAEAPVLYGGSVDAENVVSYVSLETVDGVLVGGASSKLEGFVELIRNVENHNFQ